MPLETVFLDAGGVFLYPNWWRVSDALATHGVHVSPERLKAADPPARRELDDLKVIGGAPDATPRWLFFLLVPAPPRVGPSRGAPGARARPPPHYTPPKLWESSPRP